MFDGLVDDSAIGQEETILRQMAMELGLGDESKRAAGYSSHYLMPLFEPPQGLRLHVDGALRDVLPARFCRRHGLVPLAVDASTVEVAIGHPDCLPLADEVRRLSGLQMRPLFARPSVIAAISNELFGVPSSAETSAVQSVDGESGDAAPSTWNCRVSDLGLSDADTLEWQSRLVADSGLTVISGRRDGDKQPLVRLWSRWSREIHSGPICVWNESLDACRPRAARLDECPSLVVVGDIQSVASAQYALHRVLEGHRVLVVMHARDYASTILRLRALGGAGEMLAEQIDLMIHVSSSPQLSYQTLVVRPSLRAAWSRADHVDDLRRVFLFDGDVACGL